MSSLWKNWDDKGTIEVQAFWRMWALLFTPLVQDQIPLLFGAPMHLRVSISNAFKPLAVNVGIGHSHIVGLEPHRHSLTSNVRGHHSFMPVLQSVDRDATSPINFGLACSGCG